jgi:hypothetical protein
MSENSSRRDLPVTREVIERLDQWVHRLTAHLRPAAAVPTGHTFRWEFRERTPLVLLVAKAVRMASGLRAAMLLAEAGFVTEAAALLRMVSDYATEAFAVAEGELRGKPTKAQLDFVDQFFQRTTEPDEASNAEKKRYVGREELMKAHVRLSNDAGLDGEETRALLRLLNGIQDSYVHGAYSTAMELYHGGRQEFMLHGHEDPARRRLLQTAVAALLPQVVQVLGFIALVAGDNALYSDIRESLAGLVASREQELSPDAGN